MKSNKRLLGRLKEPGQIVIETCANGLVDCAAPIIIKGRHIASLATGQLLLKPPDIARFKRQARMFGYDEQKYLAALREIPVVSEEKLKGITALLGEIASLISEIGYTNLTLKEEAVLLDKEITERKRMEEQLKESMERYHELLRIDRSSRLGELTASLAHELNQPLGAILSNAQAALRFLASGKNDPEMFREILQNIVRDDKRAADVIRSLRSMVKKAETRREPININEALSEVIAITHAELSAHNVRIGTLFGKTLPSVIADITQIEQIALNLIMNAVDAMAHSAPDKRRIILQTELLDGFVRTSVHDCGPGIPAEDVGRVFDTFYTTKITGLGMGLAVCKSIITDHGGRIWAENNPEGGATFSFTLKAEDHD
jgi:C4-dicarboxylate-specific signal transduction histidine kinase